MSTSPKDLFRAPPELEPERPSKLREDVALAKAAASDERDAFLASDESRRLFRRVEAAAWAVKARARRRRFFVSVGVSAALAAGLAILVLRTPIATDPELVTPEHGGAGRGLAAPDDIRLKGGPSLSIVRKRGPETARVRDGDTLRPGDSLRFAYASARRYVLVLCLEAGGAVTVFHPFGGRASVPLPSKQGVLAGAVELDASVGEERIVAVFSDAPVPLEAARAAVERAWPTSAGRRVVAAEATLELAGAESASVWYRKGERAR